MSNTAELTKVQAELQEHKDELKKVKACIESLQLLEGGEGAEATPHNSKKLQQLQEEKLTLLALIKELQVKENRLSSQAGASGAAAGPGEWREEFQEIKHQLLALTSEINRHSQTTRNNEEIGKAYLQCARELDVIGALPELTISQLEGITNALEQLVRKWVKQSPEAGDGLRAFKDAVRIKAGSAQVREEQHMQPLAMELLTELGTAVNTTLIIADTHNAGPIGGEGLVGKIDCSLLAELVRQWPYLVCPIEFMLKEMEPALGQLITRFRRMFEAQPKRQFAFGAALTCDNVQLLKVHHNKETGGLSVEATKELSLCDTSARLSGTAPGVRVLAMLLAAGRDPHGFKQPFIPVQQLVKGRLLSEYQLLQPAGRAGRAEAPSAAVFRASWKQTHDSSQDSSVHGEHEVYGSISSFDSLTTGHCMDVDEESDKAQADDDFNDVIVKVGVSMKELTLLRELQSHKLAHCVQMMAEFKFEGDTSQAVILHPCCEVIGSAPDIQIVRQLGSDVAAAIQELFEAKIYHRDVSRNNIGMYKGNGYMFDLSAAKDFGDNPIQRQSSAGHPRCFTGTPLYGAVCVLEGHPHSVSSDLESLYYTLRHICYDELPDEMTFKRSRSSTEWFLARRGAFTKQQTFPSGPYAELMQQLHSLFWPNFRYWYDVERQVTVQAFQNVCNGEGAGA